MRQQEFFAITSLLLVFILAGFLYSETTITGFSSHEIKEKDYKISGTYTIKPHFEVHEDYDFQVYEGISTELSIITNCIEKGEAPETCVEQVNTKNKEQLGNCVNTLLQKSGFDFITCIMQAVQSNQHQTHEWTTYCDEGEERFFYDVVKTYQDCFDSGDTDCLCALDYQTPSYIEKNKFEDGEYTLMFTQQENPTRITVSNTKSTLQYLIKGGDQQSVYLPRKLEVEYGRNYVDKISLLFKTSEWSDNRNLLFSLYKHEFLGQKRVDFVRHTGSALQYPERDGYVLDEKGNIVQTSNMRECQKPPQNIYRFCVKQNQKIVARNDATQKVEKQPITIKLAAYISDPPPLPVRNVQVMDRSKEDKSLLIMWEENKEEDVASYNLYYQQDLGLSPFAIQENAPLANVKQQATVITLPLSSLKSENDWTSTPIERNLFFEDGKPFCEYTSGFFTSKKCEFLLYDDQRDEINSEELYKIKFGDEAPIYLYSLPLDPQFVTDFLVTAVDERGNEIKYIEQAVDDQGQEIGYPIQKSVAVVDDLPPSADGVISLFSELFSRYDSTKKSVTFPWINAPTENIDESPVTDFKNQYTAYYIKNPLTTLTDEWTLEQFAGIITYRILPTGEFVLDLGTTSPQLNDKYHFVIVANDDKGNPQTNVKLKELETRETTLTISTETSPFTEPIVS